MEHSVELCGVHTARDELAWLRRELSKLGVDDTTPSSSLPDPSSDPQNNHTTQLLVDADPEVRVDGEAIATRLELAHEEAMLQVRLAAYEDRRRFESSQRNLSNQEASSRRHIEEALSLFYQRTHATLSKEAETITLRLARRAVENSHRQAGLELLQHNRLIVSMDEHHLKAERRHHALVSAEQEAQRRDAEAEERRRMTAEKRMILPEEDLDPKRLPPFLLTSFERFLPPEAAWYGGS